MWSDNIDIYKKPECIPFSEEDMPRSLSERLNEAKRASVTGIKRRRYVEKTLYNLLQDPRVSSWFDRAYSIINPDYDEINDDEKDPILYKPQTARIGYALNKALKLVIKSYSRTKKSSFTRKKSYSSCKPVKENNDLPSALLENFIHINCGTLNEVLSEGYRRRYRIPYENYLDPPEFRVLQFPSQRNSVLEKYKEYSKRFYDFEVNMCIGHVLQSLNTGYRIWFTSNDKSETYTATIEAMWLYVYHSLFLPLYNYLRVIENDYNIEKETIP